MVDRLAETPMDEYRRRLLAHEERESSLKATHVWVGYVRVALVVAFLVAAWFTIFQRYGPRWVVAVPIVLFLVAGVVHGRVLRRLSVARGSAELYRVGMARIEDRWAGVEGAAGGWAFGGDADSGAEEFVCGGPGYCEAGWAV